MARGYATFNTLAEAQAWIALVDGELGYPNATTLTYSIPVKHTTNDTYSVFIDETSASRQGGLEIMDLESARSSGYIRPAPDWIV